LDALDALDGFLSPSCPWVLGEAGGRAGDRGAALRVGNGGGRRGRLLGRAGRSAWGAGGGGKGCKWEISCRALQRHEGKTVGHRMHGRMREGVVRHVWLGTPSNFEVQGCSVIEPEPLSHATPQGPPRSCLTPKTTPTLTRQGWFGRVVVLGIKHAMRWVLGWLVTLPIFKGQNRVGMGSSRPVLDPQNSF
jgi:hypothetical protein